MTFSVFRVACLVVVMSGTTLAQQVQPPAAAEAVPAAPLDSAWTSFAASVDDYVKLRARIRQELPPLTVTTKPGEISAASDAIAQAVQRANPKAPQGRFFTQQTAAEIRRRIDQYARSYDLSSVIAPDAEERETVRGFNVYTRFPKDSVMQSMPPGLLAQLPPLPKLLEYRLVGRVLILRDTDAALVLDYLPNAVPVVK
jgi:hypothetical protein